MKQAVNERVNKTKVLVLNGIIAAVYLVITIAISFMAQGAIQFRLSEALNHLVVFNKKLMWGVFGGVVIYNLLYSGWLDVVFGGGQTFIALGITAILSKYIADKKVLLVINTLLFTVSMALIALMLHITIDLPFWATYGTTAFGEFVVMAITAPLMYYVDSKINFAKQTENP